MSKPASFRRRIQMVLRLERALRLVWQTARGWTLVNTVLVLAQGALPLASLYLMKRIVDTMTASIAATDKAVAFEQVVFWILVAGGVAILTALIHALAEYTSEMQSLLVTDAVADILHAQSIAVDLEYYEDPSYYDTLHRAQEEAPYRPTRIVNGLIQVAQNSIALIGILGLLFSFNGFLALILLCATLPGVLTRLLYSERLYGFRQAQTEKERLAWYYHTVLTDARYAKELRLFDLGLLFKTRYHDVRQQIRAGKYSLARRRVFSDSLSQTLVTTATFGTLAWIAFQTLQGVITLGDMVVYYLGFQSGLNFFQAALRALVGLYEDNLFLTNLYQFLDLAPKIIVSPQPCAVPQPMPRSIVFHNVGFHYPGRKDATLQDIELTLAPGEVIALVGENGSGKTTLIKLLCRLYDPTRGSICVDGVDLLALDPVRWRREISVTSQDYGRYALKAWENIWLGDVAALYDSERIAEAGRRSGADTVVHRLPHAYDTMLGHRFQNGQELSEGEWQKMALARTFWREARLLILDEPSSSLDPLAEAELFREFRELLDGRSAILISHRFSTVQMADCIYVMEQGRIVERGTHSALLAQNGRYTRLYRAQAQHYQDIPD